MSSAASWLLRARAAFVATTLAAMTLAVGAAHELEPPQQQQQQQQPQRQQQQEQQPALPRFRAGANLVRVDAYVTAAGKPVADLTVDDFEVLEDGRPQRLESFQVIRPRGPAAQSERLEPNTVAQSRAMAADPNARLFVLFMDIWHTRIEGSYHAQGPITRLLDRLIGQDDLIGVMTSDMRARDLTLARRTATIEGILRDNWYWGRPSLIRPNDQREEALATCFGRDLALLIVARLREQETLDAIEELVEHLETLRDERKFVVLLTEGWQLFTPDPQLGVPSKGAANPRGEPIGIGADPNTGRPRVGTNDTGDYAACERDRQAAAMVDNARRFTVFLQRANRANVSFYPVDTRGLVVFDAPISNNVPLEADTATTRGKHETLRTLALNTDGYAIVDTNAVDRALERMVADTNLYYLLGYYSTNTRLDGKFRKLTVRVKRQGMDVRSRPGYLAPTEEEAEASSRQTSSSSSTPEPIPPEVKRALDSLKGVRADLPLRTTAIAAADRIWLTAELDAVPARSDAWLKGGTARLTLLQDGAPVASAASAEATLTAGQRVVTIMLPQAAALPPGRYVVRTILTPAGGVTPLRVDSPVLIDDRKLIGSGGLVFRRGPATGTQYVATADVRFLRTERIRLEVPRLAAGGVAAARLLNKAGAALAVSVAVSERDDPARGNLIVADLTLAPLAQGDYALEVALEKDGDREVATQGFRLVP